MRREIDIYTALVHAQRTESKSLKKFITDIVKVAIRFKPNEKYSDIIIDQLWPDVFAVKDKISTDA